MSYFENVSVPYRHTNRNNTYLLIFKKGYGALFLPLKTLWRKNMFYIIIKNLYLHHHPTIAHKITKMLTFVLPTIGYCILKYLKIKMCFIEQMNGNLLKGI